MLFIASNKSMSQWTEKIIECAEIRFGIKTLLPVQLLVMHNIMEALYPEEDRDYYTKQLVILPTGTGKSLCFQLPAYLSESPTIIIYPLLSLINDQLRRMNESGLKSYKIVGGMSNSEHKQVVQSLQDKECKCVLTNPETLENDRIVAILASTNPGLVVIDEAHCISKWGKSFRASYLHVGKKIETLKPSAVVAFTATASDTVIQDVKELLFLEEDAYLLRGNANRENITFSTLYCINRDEALVSLLTSPEYSNNADEASKSNEEEPVCDSSEDDVMPTLPLGMHPVHSNFNAVSVPALVFCSTRSLCYRTALMLRDTLGHNNIFFYHAGLSKEEKRRIESWFLHSEDGILIATCAYGMGIDKSNIRTVIHYEPYTDLENFLQETGRAGRDKEVATSIMLADIDRLWIAQPRQNAKVQAAYSNSKETMLCRREYFMQALGMECESCSGCDVCVGAYPIIQSQWHSIIHMLEKFAWCFDETRLVQELCSQYQHNTRNRQGFTEQSIAHAIASLLDAKVLQKGKFLWKDKIGLHIHKTKAI